MGVKKNFVNSSKKYLFLIGTFFFVFLLFMNYICQDNNSCWINNKKKLFQKDEKFMFFQPLSLRSNNQNFFENNHQNLITNKLNFKYRFKDEKNLKKIQLVSFDKIFSNSTFNYNIYGEDVIVFLHIQKTGGTSFGKRLVNDLILDNPCKCIPNRKRYICLRPTSLTQKSSSKYWLFSRYTTGWMCGLHADWTDLKYCVNKALNKLDKNIIKRRYFFVTILREPVSRFLSEFRHVKRGATWKASQYYCDNKIIDNRKCYSGNNWKNVDLLEYIKCSENLAINRQTRMLADLSLVGCLNNFTDKVSYERELLKSAKNNLKKMAFFGILEHQKISQFIFESVFKMKFLHNFIQLNETYSSIAKSSLTNTTYKLIQSLNYLDLELYEFGKKLMFKRFDSLNVVYNFTDFQKSKLELNLNSTVNLEKFPEIRLIQKMKKLKKT